MEEIKILFVGDYCPIGRNKNLLEKKKCIQRFLGILNYSRKRLIYL